MVKQVNKCTNRVQITILGIGSNAVIDLVKIPVQYLFAYFLNIRAIGFLVSKTPYVIDCGRCGTIDSLPADLLIGLFR